MATPTFFQKLGEFYRDDSECAPMSQFWETFKALAMM
jgi:hypothetical protein